MLKFKKLQYHSNEGKGKEKEKERGEGKEEKEKKAMLQFGYFGDSFWPKKLLDAKGEFWR